MDDMLRKAIYNREWRKKNKEHLREYNRQYHARNRNYAKEYRLKNIEKFMVKEAKKRALKKDLPFNITEEDILIPEFCPILNVKLERCGNQNYAPSLDRLIPELGYVKGNVAVISHRANVLKNNMSIDEIIKMAEWIKDNAFG